MPKESRDQFGPAETKKRFEAALRGARITGPKPMKDVKSKKRKPKTRKAK